MVRTELEGNRPKVNRTCLECRRRKIRCDGSQPCRNCVWYIVPQNCQYQVRKRRHVVSPSSGRSASIDQPQTAQDAILSKLFPTATLQSLSALSRAELIRLAQDSSRPQSPRPDQIDQGSESDEEREWNEPQENQDPVAAAHDDVNGLSLLNRQHRSYLGVSSVRAVLATIFRLNPAIQAHVKNKSTTWEVVNDGANSYNSGRDTEPAIDETACVDAYFLHVQCITPMLDEHDFRTTFLSGHRSDGPWLALRNMVLTLGAIAAGGLEDYSHKIYYQRARAFFDLEFLGAGCIESLQALCLLGGYYLHYKYAPNMAHAVMGAAFRIAIALGLHRETTRPSMTDSVATKQRLQIHRNTWWSLFCLDTWAYMTLGRPTQGRWDPKTMFVPISFSGSSQPSDPAQLSLLHSQAFCKIATRVQDRFAQLSPMSISEMRGYDLEVQTWYQHLPSELREVDNCPERLLTAHWYMNNRFFNLRLLLRRPVLLSYANRRVSLASLTDEEQSVIQECRHIACSAIDHKAAVTRSPNRVLVWNTIWYLYQASLVPLLSIVVDREHPDVEMWKTSVEKALQLFESLAPWTKAADRSRDMLASIYETLVMPTTTPAELNMAQEFDMLAWDQFGMNTWDENWSWDAMNGFEDRIEDFGNWMVPTGGYS